MRKRNTQNTMKKTTLATKEARLALWLLTPSLLIVFSIVLFPVFLNFWVSVKPVRLGDLRPPTPLVRERVSQINDDTIEIRYQIRNSNPNKPIERVHITDTLPPRLTLVDLTPPFTLKDSLLSVTLTNLPGKYSESFVHVFHTNKKMVGKDFATLEDEIIYSSPVVRAVSDNILTNFHFTLDNYRTAANAYQLVPAIMRTVFYALFGSLGALMLGLCAALLVNHHFPGRGLVRGLFLFPYVAPIVAVVFVWIFLLDPLSGTINQILVTLGITAKPINFLSSRPTAFLSVIFFDAWRYFPFCYLFILARLKSIPKTYYESAGIDGAGILVTFWYITLPQLKTVMSAIFLLRFIWTFNRFDDIFLLTGGVAGTTTLPIQVYDQAIAAGNIGGGAATSVYLFVMLAFFLVWYSIINRKQIEADA